MPFRSPFMNTISYGKRRKKLIIRSSSTGGGKSRDMIAEVCYTSASHLWDYDTHEFIPNPNGGNLASVYIGTEMDVEEEVSPIMWSVISGVEENKIRENTLTEEEDERVDKAIEILEQSKILLLDEPEFDIERLDDIVDDAKLLFGDDLFFVAFDYIMFTLDLALEFKEKLRGLMSIREDMVLLNLSKELKNLAKKYNICLMTATQIAGADKHSDVRDETILRGCKAIADKADVGYIFMPVNLKERKLIIPMFEELEIEDEPTHIGHFYKNRGGIYNNIKVVYDLNLGNLHQKDICVLKEDYSIEMKINKTYLSVVGGEIKPMIA